MRPVPVDFDLAITPSSSGYVAHVVDSPAGEASAAFALPLSNAEIRATVSELAGASADGTLTSGGRLALESLGRGLFEAVFSGEVYAGLRRSLDAAARDGRDLRIRLRLSDAPELIDLPWEFLYFPARGVYVAADRGTPLVRYLDLADGAGPLHVDLPVRVLAVASSPVDLPHLDAGAERRKLEAAVAPLVTAGQLTVTWAADGTLSGVSRALDDDRPHVLHFIGHGDWDEATGTGVLFFESDPATRRSAAIRADTLAAAFQGQNDLRLIVLNACEGARTGQHDAFAGLSQALARAGMPAVVAMQFPITDDAAIRFAGALYGALSAGEGVDAAVTSSRHEMLVAQEDVEWATPALYLRARDARLFELPGVAPATAPPRPAPPPLATISSGPLTVSNASTDGVRLEPADPTVPTLRPRPVRLLPADFPALVGRDADLAAVSSSLANGSFGVYGERGIGKTSLLRHLTNRLATGDDVVHLRRRGQTVEDLGQALFEAFYSETTPPLRPSEPQLRHYLGQVSGVVAIDDADLDADDVDDLLDTAPTCRFLLASEAQALSDPGRSRHLAGIDASAGTALIAVDLGRSLSTAEAQAAAAIVQSAGGSPARILQAIAPVREGTSTLAEVGAAPVQVGAAPTSGQVGAAPAPGQVGAAPALAGTTPAPGQVGATPAPGQVGAPAPDQAGAAPTQAPQPSNEGAARTRQLLTTLGGAPLGLDHIVALTGARGSDVAALARAGVIAAQSPRYALTTGAAVTPGAPTDPAAYELLPYLAAWTESHRGDPDEVLDEAEAILAAMDRGASQGRWGEVARLGHAVEDVLFAERRWGQWRVVLAHLEAAAQQMADRRELARVQHQLGSRAGALGDLEGGTALLASAAAMRDANGETVAAALSRHNLGVLKGLIPPPSDGGEPEPGPTRPTPLSSGGAGIPFIPILVGLAVLLLAGVVGVVAGVLPPRPASPAPVARLDVDQSRLSFGEVELGSRSAPMPVAVRNSGAATARLSGTTLEPPVADFVIDSKCPDTLAAGDSCTLDVSFAPTASGPRDADLVVASDSPGDAPRVHLSGTGRPLPGAPALGLDHDSIAFGEVRIGQPASTTLRLTSQGETPLRITSVAQPDAPFSVEAGDCLGRDIDQKQSCVLTISFAPTESSAYVGSLTIESNAQGSPHSVALSGGGVGEAELSVDPASVDFGAHRRDEAPPTATVTVSNRGNLATTIGKVSIPDTTTEPDGGATFALSSDDCSGATVAPGASCQIAVTFAPHLAAADGSKATLTIPRETGEALTVPLTGSVQVLPDLVGEAGSQAYEWTGKAITVPVSVVVSNRGEAPAGTFAIRAWVASGSGEPAPVAFQSVFGEAKLVDGYAETVRDLKAGDSLKLAAALSIPIDDPFVDHVFRLEVHVDDCVVPTDQPPACRVAEADETNNTIVAGDITVPAAPQ